MTYRPRGDSSKNKTQVCIFLSFSFSLFLLDSHTHLIFTLTIISCLAFAETREMPETTVLSSSSTHNNDFSVSFSRKKRLKSEKKRTGKEVLFRLKRISPTDKNNKTSNEILCPSSPPTECYTDCCVCVYSRTEMMGWRREGLSVVSFTLGH